MGKRIRADPRPEGKYKRILSKVFTDRFRTGLTEVGFEREDLVRSSQELGIDRIKNLGDIIYSTRYRSGMPRAIVVEQPEGLEWIVRSRGGSRYAFVLVPFSRVIPNPLLISINIPDSTPEIIRLYRMGDEQALLAIIRYNRLIDIFLGLTAYSLQNHLRTTVNDLGQIEIDELYLGVDKNGAHYVIPVQAKVGDDQIGVVQAEQDLACCAQKFPGVICRAISVQFMRNQRIAMFEITIVGDELRVVEEKHYDLVPSDRFERLPVNVR